MTENFSKLFLYKGTKQIKAPVLSSWEETACLNAAEEFGYLPIFKMVSEYGLRQRKLMALK